MDLSVQLQKASNTLLQSSQIVGIANIMNDGANFITTHLVRFAAQLVDDLLQCSSVPLKQLESIMFCLQRHCNVNATMYNIMEVGRTVVSPASAYPASGIEPLSTFRPMWQGQCSFGLRTTILKSDLVEKASVAQSVDCLPSQLLALSCELCHERD